MRAILIRCTERLDAGGSQRFKFREHAGDGRPPLVFLTLVTELGAAWGPPPIEGQLYLLKLVDTAVDVAAERLGVAEPTLEEIESWIDLLESPNVELDPAQVPSRPLPADCDGLIEALVRTAAAYQERVTRAGARIRALLRGVELRGGQ
jgi:hypothetical protein